MTTPDRRKGCAPSGHVRVLKRDLLYPGFPRLVSGFVQTPLGHQVKLIVGIIYLKREIT
jgi:hypothetical protein